MKNIAYPQLMFVHGEKYENQVFSNVISDTRTSFTRTIPEFTIGAPVLKPTNHPNWLVLVSSIQLHLWNPVTLQSIELPQLLELKSAECISHVILTKSPDHLDSSILIWLKDPRSILFCYVNGDDDQTWTHNLMKNYIEELDDDEFLKYPVVCGDDTIFMFSSLRDSMFKVETVKPLIIRPVKSTMSNSYNFAGPSRYGECFLMACCGDMFKIDLIYGRVRNDIDGVMVLKFDFSDMSWNIVDSCPNISFFISGNQAISCPVSTIDSSQVGNRVYLTCFIDDAHTQFKYYTYHIQQKKLKVSLLATPENVSHSYWIQVDDAQTLEKAKENYHSGGDYHSDEHFIERKDDELLISNNNYLDENHETLFGDLPIDILRIISSRLINPVDYLSFRSVSKFCLSMGSAKEWRNILGHVEEDNNDPWLMAPFLFNKGVYSMLDPLSHNKHYTVMPKTLDKYSNIYYSSKGKLLMSSHVFNDEWREYTLKMWLYNPLTKKIVSLPKSPFMLENLLVKAGNVVLGVTLEFFRDFFYISSEKSERELEWHGGRLREESGESNLCVGQSNVNVVCVGNFYYLLVKDGNLVYFSEEDNCLKTYFLEEPCALDSIERIFLVEFDGDLLSIYIGNEWKWVRIFKFNQSEVFWEEVRDLKNNNVYVSTITSIITKATSPDIGDRIYFPRLYKGSIIYYSLKTNKFHMCDNQNSVMDIYYGSDEQLYSCWFQPTFN